MTATPVTHRAFESVSVGDALPSKTIDIDRARLVQYAGASGDRNRIHWDEAFAKSVGLPDVIAHGMFTMSAVAELLSAWAGDGGRVLSYGTRFTNPVVVPYDEGAQVIAAGVVKSLDAEKRTAVIDVTVTCRDAKVMGRTQATIALA